MKIYHIDFMYVAGTITWEFIDLYLILHIYLDFSLKHKNHILRCLVSKWLWAKYISYITKIFWCILNLVRYTIRKTFLQRFVGNYFVDTWIALNHINLMFILLQNLFATKVFFKCLRFLDAWCRQEMSIHWNRKISFFSIVKFLCNWEIKKLPSSCYE